MTQRTAVPSAGLLVAGHDAMVPAMPLALFAEPIAVLIAAYRERWSLPCFVCDGQGRREDHETDGDESSRRLAIEEALRWGEPCIVPGHDQYLWWAVPLMLNGRCLGGLAVRAEADRMVNQRRTSGIDGRAACAHLRELAILHNLTNGALLDANRLNAHHEAARAEAIHTVKRLDRTSIHDAWISEEPALIAAIQRGDDREARHRLNRVLVVLYSAAGADLRLLKTFVMELVVTMARTVVEAGAPADRAAIGLSHLTSLVAIEDDEQLQRWVARCLNDLLEAVLAGRRSGDGVALAQAMRIIEKRFAEPLGRDQVAKLCKLSPAHFSRRFSAFYGASFNQVLNRVRCERAARLLADPDRTLSSIALDCGFADQSWFTKVFRRHLGCTPKAWRRQHAATR